jgi:hypothetical protein
MKKSIANKIEKLLSSLVTTSCPKNDDNKIKGEGETEELHFEKNPDKPYNMKMPSRLMELLRPKRNPGFR